MNCQAIAGADACLSMIRETVFLPQAFPDLLLLFFVFQEILSVFRTIISIRDNPTVLPTLFLEMGKSM
jgi:hypothetical protein